ncbi:MAG TPA: helix-turn-helix transcriptional regulator [Caulobacteraceae bacterium]|nr:helix-turn-helix transcriptional regulator [Caulobacteraceae bacterium]
MVTDDSLESQGAADWGGRWLDAQGMAVVVLSRDLAVVWSSRAVQETLSPEGPVMLRDGYLAGATRGHQNQLAGLLDRAAVGAAAADMFDHAEPERRLIVSIRALDGAMMRFGASVRRERREIVLPDLTGAFGLTNAEQLIVRRLMQGWSATDVADDLGAALLTVRTHIKRAYAKLGVHSKEQLFAKLLAFVG